MKCFGGKENIKEGHEVDVTICVPSYGEGHWRETGLATARATCERLNCVVIHFHHNDSLCEARNNLLELTHTEYIIFLDADDELDSHYLEEMSNGTADVLVPSVKYIRNRVAGPAHIPRVVACSHDGSCAPACLALGNYVVIGAAARTEALKAVGGFKDWPFYEDWDLWLRLYQHGYSFQDIPGAIYLANWSESSRNRSPTQAEKAMVHNEIAKANGV